MSTQVAGENPPTPGSGPSSPSSVEPGVSDFSGANGGGSHREAPATASTGPLNESAQSAASLSPPSVARTNTTAGSGAGETAGPERTVLERVRDEYIRHGLRLQERLLAGKLSGNKERRAMRGLAYYMEAATNVQRLIGWPDAA